jgi:hypothetical protein
MVPVETLPGIGEGGIWEANGGENSVMIYLIHCKIFVNTTIIHTQNNNKENN